MGFWSNLPQPRLPRPLPPDRSCLHTRALCLRRDQENVNLPGRLHSTMLEFLSGDLAEATGDGQRARHTLPTRSPHVCRRMYLAIHLDRVLVFPVFFHSRVLSPNGRGGWTPLRPLRGLQETRVATREESGVLGFPSRRGLTRQPLIFLLSP